MKNKSKDVYKKRYELLMESLNKERGRIDNILRDRHRHKDYKECLSLVELQGALDWILEVAEHIYKTGRDM